jgi:hypothetical protein
VAQNLIDISFTMMCMMILSCGFELWVQYPFWFKKTGPEPGFRFILGAKTALAVGFIAKSRK